jgi:tetratricopeptide (TPR) repeat protein
MNFLFALVLLCSPGPTLSHLTPALPQTSSDQSQQGIELYQKGDFQEAAKVLKAAAARDKNNVIVWHHLGLALEAIGKLSDARKAHEKAAKAGEALLTSKLSRAEGPRYVDSLTSISSELRFASASASKYLQLNPKAAKSNQWTERADLLTDFAELSSGTDSGERLGKLVSGKEVTAKVRILSKPEPQYTEDARRNQITGTVILRAVFGRDGKIHAVVPVKSLPNGLTGMSIRAAHQIRFVPAMKDDQPVSMLLQIEYNFNLY